MKLIHFCLFLPYWEKSKTFPGDTKVRTTWILSDAIQKSPSRNLLSQRRKERGNKQDLFLKTETFMHLKAGREVEQSKFAGHTIPFSSGAGTAGKKEPCFQG